MRLLIPYKKMMLIPYQGAGNRTPILDMSSIKEIQKYDYYEIKSYLERNKVFRIWLKKEGEKLNADTVMIYYRSCDAQKPYLFFIGEPNASLTTKFSAMCGNGIRCLALHIFMNAGKKQRKIFLENGIRLWADDLKITKIIQFDPNEELGDISVRMGKFQQRKGKLINYINENSFNQYDLSCIRLLSTKIPAVLRERYFGIGFNSNNDVGEPHLVLVNTIVEYQKLAKDCGFNNINKYQIMESLPQITAYLGRQITFKKTLFPHGINFNLSVLYNGQLFICTHERNILSDSKKCFEEQKKKGVCKCVTLACGTGGAVTANISKIQGYCDDTRIVTRHRGGTIVYIVKENDTIMIGPARKINQV